MKVFSVNRPAFYAAILLYSLLVAVNSNAQSRYQSAGGVKITIEGTSNIHDWDMKSEKGTCSGVFNVGNNGTVTSLSALNFSVPAESLKSEHSGMDKNTYKALNTGKYASISFTAGPATIKPSGNSGHILTANGKLTIAGVTKDVTLTANGVVNADKSITYTGSYQLKMTDFNVDPPKAMLGAIKTGNSIVVKFNLVLKSSNSLSSL
jgi:hypothetical protein